MQKNGTKIRIIFSVAVFYNNPHHFPRMHTVKIKTRKICLLSKNGLFVFLHLLEMLLLICFQMLELSTTHRTHWHTLRTLSLVFGGDLVTLFAFLKDALIIELAWIPAVGRQHHMESGCHGNQQLILTMWTYMYTLIINISFYSLVVVFFIQKPTQNWPKWPIYRKITKKMHFCCYGK